MPIIFSIRSSMIGSFADKSIPNISIIKLYNTFDPTVTPDRNLGSANDLYSTSSPIPLPQEHHSWFWRSKTPVTSEKLNGSRLDRGLGNGHMITHLAMVQPTSPLLMNASSSQKATDAEQPPRSRPHSISGGSRQSSSISVQDIIDIERHGSTDSFVSARGFPSDVNDSRSYRSASYDDGESYRSTRSRRTSSMSSIGRMWRNWIYGSTTISDTP
jgi:hypothetical protein